MWFLLIWFLPMWCLLALLGLLEFFLVPLHESWLIGVTNNKNPKITPPAIWMNLACEVQVEYTQSNRQTGRWSKTVVQITKVRFVFVVQTRSLQRTNTTIMSFIFHLNLANNLSNLQGTWRKSTTNSMARVKFHSN